MTTRKHPQEPHESERGRETADTPGARETAKLEGKIAELEAASAEAKDRYMRLAADFENFKKRARSEQLETIQHASAELINRLLPGLDDLHKALDHEPKGIDPSWLKGVELSVPKLHEAVGHEESDEHPEDTVVSELRRGYRIRDRVVRPALVKLARRPELPADSSSESRSIDGNPN